MIRIKTVLLLTKKEILSLMDTPATSIGLIVFVVLWQFLFFRNAFLVGEASLRTLFDYLPWLLLLFASAVTMGIFSQEKNEGTLELLLTHPVREIEVVLSKFLGSWLLILCGLFFAFPIAIAFSRFAVFDWGAFIGQFFSGVFFAGCLVALGMFFSGLLTSPIASLLATAAISFFLVVAGSEFITANLPLSIVSIFERLSLSSHVASMSRGVIDTRDFWYFLSFIIIFLSLSYLMLLKQKYGNRKDYYWRYQIGVILFILIAVVSNVVGSRIPGRLDLTADKKYSISSSTREIVSTLPDIVTITFYASSRLPSQLAPVVRDVKDILRDYQQFGKGNITVIQKDPSNNPEIASEATMRGVREVQFNVIGQEEFQLKTGSVGIVISYGDTHEAIPLIQQTGDLEYQLTSLIAKLTSKEKKKIVFLSGHGEKNITTDYQILNEELVKQFTVDTITIDDANPTVASDAALLVIAGPTQPIDQKSRDAITNFINTGKSVAFFLDTYSLNPQTVSATVSQNSFADFLKQYGVTINSNIAFDLRSNETIRMGQSGMNVLLPYPFWIRALPTKSQSPIVNRLNGVSFPWPASIDVDETKISQLMLKAAKLLTTSPFAGTQSENVSINPNTAVYSQDNLREQQLAVLISGPQQSSPVTQGKLIVVGDSDFLTEQFIQSSPQNLTFALSAFSYLSEQNSLVDIRVKQSEPSKLIFKTPFQQTAIKYANLVLAIVVPSGVVLVRLLKRKSLRNNKFR